MPDKKKKIRYFCTDGSCDFRTTKPDKSLNHQQAHADNAAQLMCYHEPPCQELRQHYVQMEQQFKDYSRTAPTALVSPPPPSPEKKGRYEDFGF